jgi:hypothetical protein
VLDCSQKVSNCQGGGGYKNANSLAAETSLPVNSSGFCHNKSIEWPTARLRVELRAGGTEAYMKYRAATEGEEIVKKDYRKKIIFSQDDFEEPDHLLQVVTILPNIRQ